MVSVVSETNKIHTILFPNFIIFNGRLIYICLTIHTPIRILEMPFESFVNNDYSTCILTKRQLNFYGEIQGNLQYFLIA